MIDFYRRLKPGARAWIVRAAAIVLVLLVGYPIYRASSHKPQRQKKKGEYKVLQGDAETFEKALFHKTKQEMEELRKEIKQLKEAQSKAPVIKSGKPNQEDMDRLKESIEDRLRKDKVKAPPVDQQIFANVAGQNLTKNLTSKEEKPKLGIKTIVGVAPEKGSDNDTIHLPPSFMDASLLTGVVAPATRVGEDNPTPMLIRIKEMAVLPNEVKEDLKGCFVVAEGSGNLAQERVKTRLLNLSCITKKGDAIIDQPIKGWVVDADGRAGLSGHVVAKFGSHVARVAIAGFLEGFGKALELSVTETTTNVFGTQSSQLEDTSGETLAKAGAGRSVVNVAKDLQKFYLQLASQTMPVIEVGPTKNITVVISEGEELVIKERKKYAQKD
jgi:conjugal transfer pilus assembly protein TraB